MSYFTVLANIFKNVCRENNISRYSMLQLMTWGEIMEDFKLEGQLKMAAIFDSTGEKIAETDGAMMTSEEAIVVLKTLETSSVSIYSLILMGSKFSCMNVDTNTLIGQSDDDVIVVHKNQDMLISAISGAGSRNSCLATVKKFASRLVAEGTPGASSLI